MNQIQWEEEAYAQGMDKFFDEEQRARWDGKMDSTAVGSSVLRQRVGEIAKLLEKTASKPTAGRGGAYINALRVAATRHDGKDFYQDYHIPAYIGLITMLQHCYQKNDNGKYLTNMTVEIGRRLEYDQKLYVFRKDNPAFVGTIETSLAQQGVTSLSHKLKTYQKKWRDADMRWDDWGKVKQVHVGVRVVKAVLLSMDDCFVLTKKHNGQHLRHYIDTTLDFDDFVVSETDMLSKTMPILNPLLEQPLDWQRIDGEIVGGYHTPELRRATPFVKTKGQEHREFVEHAYPHKHITAVNHLQATEWEINQPVVDAIREYVKLGITFDVLPRADKLEVRPHPGDDCPDEEHKQWLQDAKRIHGKNKQNTNELIVLSQSLKMADKLKGRGFFYAYTCDFRGRLYCSATTLSTQGADHIKAMIRFRNPKPLGRSGIKWLAINGANKYGYDKVSYNDRVRWVISNRERIQAVAEEPTGSIARSFLGDADKPLQFLAFCHEWSACGFGTDPSAKGHLPIGLDGSCNGLQHYAALLRDPRGGAAVNLIQSTTPSDVYGEVSTEFLRLLPHGDMGLAKFHAHGPNRKLSKRPVMTLPYGSTQQSCRAYIREYIGDNSTKFDLVDNEREQWKLAVAATPYMWEAIGNCVIAARAGMEWLQTCSSMIAKLGVYARWLSPADFPVYQHYSKYDTVVVSTDLFGRIELTLEGAEVGVSGYRARNGVAPNYIHSMDSSHEVFTILEAKLRGLGDMMMVHDDFATHACDTEELFDIIRLTFVRMYYNRDWLMAWKKEMERLDDRIKLPDPPPMGDLDVLEVLESEFFFG